MKTKEDNVNVSFQQDRKHKSQRMSVKVHWTFCQEKMKLMKISQNTSGIVVSLLRFTGGSKPGHHVTVWRLPFKLDNFKSYLLLYSLNQEERSDEFLIRMLNSTITQKEKFSELILYRINKVVESLRNEDKDVFTKCIPVTTAVIHNSSFFIPKEVMDHSSNSTNSFIEEVRLVNYSFLQT